MGNILLDTSDEMGKEYQANRAAEQAKKDTIEQAKKDAEDDKARREENKKHGII